eukprot:scaffold141986_cov29-Tisochrysis_lutea.AAC.10
MPTEAQSASGAFLEEKNRHISAVHRMSDDPSEGLSTKRVKLALQGLREGGESLDLPLRSVEDSPAGTALGFIKCTLHLFRPVHSPREHSQLHRVLKEPVVRSPAQGAVTHSKLALGRELGADGAHQPG